MQAEEIKKAIYNVDTKVLAPGVVSELMKLVPTQDEITMLQTYENEVQNLAPPERFFWEMSKITKYEDRIKAL